MVEWLGDGMCRVHLDGTTTHAWAVRADHETWVYLDGAVHVVADDEVTASTRRAPDALAAPMPATVTALHVAPGQAIDAGTVLVTLEAMKMEFQVRAPRAGTVSRVNCRIGELVQPGVPLVELT